MDERREQELADISALILNWIQQRYRNGAAEHADDAVLLSDMSPKTLIENAIAEDIDGLIYDVLAWSKL